MDCGDPSYNFTNIIHLGYSTGSLPPSFTYQTNITVYCLPGYYYEDYSKTNVMTCNYFAKWTAVPACLRIYFSNEFRFFDVVIFKLAFNMCFQK